MRQIFVYPLILSVLILSSIVYGAPIGGTIQNITFESGTNTSSTTVNITAGNVTGVNITSSQVSGRWAGFWGNISAGVVVEDVAGNDFYNWTLTDVSNAVVYAVNGTVSNWGSTTYALTADMPNYLKTAAADNYTNTFYTNETLTTNSLTINANYTYTRRSGGASVLKTYSLKNGNNLIWACKAINDQTGFNGKLVDFQILAPTNSTGERYNFYLEMP